MMKSIYWKICLVLLTAVKANSGNAQPSYQQRIQDSVLYWYTPAPANKGLKPKSEKGSVYTVKQQEYSLKLIEWMRKTYTPVAGIGTHQSMYYTGDAGWNGEKIPHAYGVDFRIWNVSFMKPYLDAKNNFKPVSEESTRFGILMNAIPDAESLWGFCTADQYVFTLKPDGYAADDFTLQKRKRNNADPAIHPNVKRFVTVVNNWQCVYLVKDNQLPFVPVSRGELLRMAEKAVDVWVSVENKKVAGRYPKNDERDKKSREEVNAITGKKANHYREQIVLLRKKHQQQLDHPAYVRNAQININTDFDISNDLFEVDRNNPLKWANYPVYKIVPEVMKKCRSNSPQWIVAYFPYAAREAGNQLYHLYQTLTEHFNYQYVYDYFFDSLKVKGKPYAMLDAAGYEAKLQRYRNSEIWRSSANKKAGNVYFSEDFSQFSEGVRPAGWEAGIGYSAAGLSVVSSLKNNKGKWLRFETLETIRPNTIARPLPENFRLEYDLATDEFSSATGGSVELYLSSFPDSRIRGQSGEDKSGDGVTISLMIEPGNDQQMKSSNPNYAGNARISVDTKPQVNKENGVGGISYTYKLKEFTNVNRIVHVELEIVNGMISLKMNGQVVARSADMIMAYGKACEVCGIPKGTRFSQIRWMDKSTQWDRSNPANNPKAYISNIKITPL